jgi:uncharacterized metal-binding protein
MEKSGKDVVLACFGGFSNTGVATALASMDAVSEVGLGKANIGCLSGMPLETESIKAKLDAARRIIVVDGCPVECAKKLVERYGYKPYKAIVLARDIGMKKVSLYDGQPAVAGVAEAVTPEERTKAKEIIVRALTE